MTETSGAADKYIGVSCWQGARVWATRFWEVWVSRRSPFVVSLSVVGRMVLEERASSRSAPFGQVVRARIVLCAAEGAANVDIAKRLRVCVDVVSKWRKRFCLQGLAGLKDRPRSGRPRIFSSEVGPG